MEANIPDWKNDETVKVVYAPDGTVVIVIGICQCQGEGEEIRIVLPYSNTMTEEAIGLFVAAADVFAE